MKRDNIRLIDYLETLQSEGSYWFLRKTVMSAIGLSGDAFKLAAHRLAKKVKICRIHADFYTIVPLEYKEVGCLPATWFIDTLMQHLHANYYVGLLSAAALHGVAHQQPMAFQVIVDQLIQPITAGKLRIEFHYKKSIYHHFSMTMKTETGTMRVSTPEMTICDLVRYMDAAGQINNVATILNELNNVLRPEALAAYIEANEIEIAVIQRIGYLLEYLEINFDLTLLDSKIKRCQPHYRLLVIGSHAPVVEKNKRWRILVNEQVEPDV